MEGGTIGNTAKPLGLSGCKNTPAFVGDSQGSGQSTEAMTETGNSV
jgi:hypothetical protein